MKRLSFLLILAVASAPVQAEKTDTVKTIINSTAKSKKVSDTTKKVISGIAGTLAAILLVGGSVYGYNNYPRGSNNYKQPLLDWQDEYNSSKSNELILVLKNGQANDTKLVKTISQLITDDANPNGTDDHQSLMVAIESGRNIPVFEVLLNNGAQVSSEIVNLARQKNMDAGIINLLEENNLDGYVPSLQGYPVIRGAGNGPTARDSDVYASLAANSWTSSDEQPLSLYPVELNDI